MAKMTMPVVHVECPECHDTIPVVIDVRIDRVHDGSQEMFLTPDMTDLWAHAFTHGVTT